jgi:hypothetical protein
MAAGFKAVPDPKNGKIQLLMLDGPRTASRLIIGAKDATIIVGAVLAAAVNTQVLSGKPSPYQTKHDPVSATAVPCTGWNIGPGHQSGSLSLLFHFGEATLAIPMAQSDAQLFAQRLLAAAATADPARRN